MSCLAYSCIMLIDTWSPHVTSMRKYNLIYRFKLKLTFLKKTTKKKALKLLFRTFKLNALIKIQAANVLQYFVRILLCKLL